MNNVKYISYKFRAEIQGIGSQSEVTINNYFDKKLSCCKEAARCSVSLKILLSFKVTQTFKVIFKFIPLNTCRACKFSLFIVTMSLFCAVSEIFYVE